MERRPVRHYGWVIVNVAVIGMSLIYGIRHSFSIFFAPILDEVGWTYGVAHVTVAKVSKAEITAAKIPGPATGPLTRP